VGTEFDSLTQTLATTPGRTYTLSYWVQLDFSSGFPDEFRVLWDGSVVSGSDLTPNPGDSFPYQQFTFTVTATGASTDLTFQGINNPSWFDLDDISVQDTPEPASMTLMGIGVLGLGGYVWRRRRQRVAATPAAA
jgi:hypothetical protein